MATAAAEGIRLLEREAALETLREALDAARSGEGRLLLVAAEAGGGKTTLVRAFCAEAAGSVEILWGACDALFTPRPLGPFLDLAADAGGDLGAAIGSGRPHDVVAALLAATSARPTIVVLEDLHWADEASLDALRLLARKVERAPVLVVASYRDDEARTTPLQVVLGELATRPSVGRVSVDGLSAEAVAVLAAESEIDAIELHRQTNGNPFFVTEVLASHNGPIPATVRDAVLARVAVLGPAAKRLLEAVAIVPPRAELWLLEALAAESLDALDECLDSGILHNGGDAVGFRHELARLAVAESVDPLRARGLHRVALAALAEAPSGSPDLARLAHHAEAAGERDGVLLNAPAAAADAAAHGAYREAAAQYARALRFADRLPAEERARLLEHQSDAYYNTDDQVMAIEVLREAIECHRQAGAAQDEAAALSRIVPYYACRGLFSEAVAAGTQAVALLEAMPASSELGEAMRAMALIGLYQDAYDDAIAWATRAHALAMRFEDIPTAVAATIDIGTAEVLRDGIAGSATLEQALELARRHELPPLTARAMHNLARGALEVDAHDAAARWLDEGLAYCEEVELDLWRLALLALRVGLELDQGRWSDATATAGAIEAETRDSPDPLFHASLVLALVRARRGDPDTAPMLARAARIEANVEDPPLTTAFACAAAEVAWLERRPDGVAEATRAALDAERERGSRELGRLAYWRWKHGIVDDLPPAELPEPWCFHVAGDWRRAAAAWEAVGRPYEAALALSEADDTDALRQAHDRLQALGAGPLAAMVARALRERGARVARGPRASTRGNAAALTAREVEVLQLLAAGLRNAAIAERLFLSPRTVDHHVSGILRKLEAESRGEAVARGMQLGLVQNGQAAATT